MVTMAPLVELQATAPPRILLQCLISYYQNKGSNSYLHAKRMACSTKFSHTANIKLFNVVRWYVFKQIEFYQAVGFINRKQYKNSKFVKQQNAPEQVAICDDIYVHETKFDKKKDESPIGKTKKEGPPAAKS